jgi:hypothetical protein
MLEQNSGITDPRTQLGRGEDCVRPVVEQRTSSKVDIDASDVVTRGAELIIYLPPLEDPFEQYRDKTGGHG